MVALDALESVDILLVEDNPQDAELTMRALKRNKLLNPVHVAEDGAQALDFIFRREDCGSGPGGGQPRVVLLDLKLPKLNGLEVLRAIKGNETTRCIPVVVISSSRENPDIREAYRLGANSYVVKPVQFDEFVEAMSAIGLYWLLLNEPPEDQGFHGT